MNTDPLALVRARSRAGTFALIFGFSVLMGLLARVAVPLPFTPVPVTGQTLGVLLAGLVLGGWRAAAAMLLYLLEGVAGLPVFSPAGVGGLAQVLGPTGGYLLSYPLAAWVVGALAGRWNKPLLAVLAGELVIFLFGACWLAALLHQAPRAILVSAVWPFIPGEVLKVALALALSAGFRRTASSGDV